MDEIWELPEESHEESDFKITKDADAEWALKRIAEEEAEATRLIEDCKYQIKLYQQKIDFYTKRAERSTGYLKSLLREYFALVPHKKSKTGNESYELPSGKLWLKYPEPEFKRDDEKLVKWLESVSYYKDLIKIKKTPDWAELKKCVRWNDGIVYDEEGVVVEGVEAIEREPEFEVK